MPEIKGDTALAPSYGTCPICYSDRVAALLKARTCRNCRYGWMAEESVVEEAERQSNYRRRSVSTAGPSRLPYRDD